METKTPTPAESAPVENAAQPSGAKQETLFTSTPGTSGQDAAKAALARVADLEKQLAARDAADKKAEETRLAEQGKWQELAETRGKQAEDYKSKFERTLKVNALQSAAQEAGFRKPSMLNRLADLDAILIDGDEVKGVAEQIDKLKAEVPELFGDGKTNSVPTPSVSASSSKSIDPNRLYSEQEKAAWSDEQFSEYAKLHYGAQSKHSI